jgi:hypothetical protein
MLPESSRRERDILIAVVGAISAKSEVTKTLPGCISAILCFIRV